ncbi:MAG: vWA domain-containing protein [Haloarculaceae archaeon]
MATVAAFAGSWVRAGTAVPLEVSYTVREGLTVGVEHLWPLALLPAAVAVFAALILRGEADERSASRRSRRLLFASRVAVATLLVVGAMGPYTVQTRETPGEPTVTLLTDESASMGPYDNVTERLVADIEAEGVPVTAVTVATGTDSRVGDGIAANLQDNGTVVLVSDGRVTAGRSLGVAAEDARRLNATVSAVEPDAVRTERAVSVRGPTTASVGLATRFSVSVTGVEADDAVPVAVTVDGETVATDRLGADETLAVNHTFEERGPHQVTARIESEDVYDRNDVFYHPVRVVDRPDVLYVSGGGYPFQSYLADLYDVTNVSAVPADLDEYQAVVVQDRAAAQLGNVSALQEYVIDGGGLVVVGGENSYESGGYSGSPVAAMLPVEIGNATGGTTNIVLTVDISGSTAEGLSTQKAIALNVLSQLGDRNRVGLVAFSGQPYRVADVQRLEGNREVLADRIRRLQNRRGGTDIAAGLLGANDLLGQRRGTVILLSDGADDIERPAAVASQLGSRGTRVITVGAGDRVNEQTLRTIARESGGSYFAADETNRLRLLFGGASRRFEGENLTVVTRGTFITAGVTLTSDPGRANRVAMKPGADFQVATPDGTPAIASWRFGLGRVVSVTSYAEDNTLDGLLERPDSLVMTKSVNYAVGDPTRGETGIVDPGVVRVGERTTVAYRGTAPPDVENVSFRRVADERYEGEFTPRDAGYGRLGNATYAANYPAEYGRLGVSPGLSSLVSATGGAFFEPDEGARIARLARQQATRVRSVRETWAWVALLAAVLLFALEVIARRVQVYRGRTSLESGLP